MDYYPNTIPESNRGEDYAAYYAAFEYAVVAQRESLLRFPDAPQAKNWHWGLALNYARTGDSRAGQTYADLIAQGLNQGEVNLDYLYAWFQEREPHMAMHLVEIEPPSGYLRSFVIEVRGNGSAFIWLLQSSSAFHTFDLLTQFDFVNVREAGWIVDNLNADPSDGKEVAIYFSTLPGEFTLDPPRVFNLGQFPPVELPFIPGGDIFKVGMDYTNYWAVKANDTGENSLLFKSAVFPACPVTIRLDYHWNGTFFESISGDYGLENLPQDLSFCQTVIDHAERMWGPSAAISVMESLLPYWPPSNDTDGNPYPKDALDELRYRLGVNSMLVGDEESGEFYFNLIINNPSTELSTWIEPAGKFLAAYKKPIDIYKACQGSTRCYPGYAIIKLIEELPENQDPFEYLKSAGVPTNSSGFFDFDGDDIRERWFTVRHRPLEKLELWILAP